ncbi:amino acid/amide ABC transporter membrane protein 2, HAAT family [Pseudobacteriovorax antillogorgiicola]|uniref:Amino acid/amide ABC transporter membrane protein 2, HAAT family n=2 Tax=Pseudobacteriovorax antillogorgiicola TaxID=1513793 RepID=A0A1Y6CP91_9BACT|nr:high-affinity branched-chain amino acid ABC transporter permease LivM [Pseudobacteriovorax antillogorgiicola]TCS44418.1 amino acid/amide ABC transporter membrane protein 2 (HAAT family) [Pseudobacteriovorax antillogorgiicola]SMF79100.1 amino acid/amide ABC transporter membrane protein 2, HAAT family [Pseudobacteriovorax antillogorgiicola]
MRSALISGLFALAVFGPITGLVLDGYDFKAHPTRPFILATLVLAGSFVFNIIRGLGPQLSVGMTKRPQLKLSRPQQRSLLAGLLGLAIVLPFIGQSWITSLNFALIYVLLGLGLNIVVGLAGLLDLGFVAFYAVGAYGYALGNHYLGLGFWGAIPFAAVTAGIMGAILGFPVLRMHGDYLAIVTLGFGEIIHLVLVNWVDFTGGPSGMEAPPPTLFGMEFNAWSMTGAPLFHEVLGIEFDPSYGKSFIYFSLLAFVIGACYFCIRLKASPWGRAWEALKEDEIACRSLGINHVTVKLSAFSLGAMIGGVAGVFFAGIQELVNPDSFTFFESAIILAIVVLGGMGSIPGVILAAITLRMLPEVLRDFQEYRILIFGVLMVAMMIWRPSGLVKTKRKSYAKLEV